MNTIFTQNILDHVEVLEDQNGFVEHSVITVVGHVSHVLVDFRHRIVEDFAAETDVESSHGIISHRKWARFGLSNASLCPVNASSTEFEKDKGHRRGDNEEDLKPHCS